MVTKKATAPKAHTSHKINPLASQAMLVCVEVHAWGNFEGFAEVGRHVR